MRRRLLSFRDALAESVVKDVQTCVATLFFRQDFAEKPQTVALYAPIRNEVGTDALLKELRRRNKRTFFPRVRGEDLEFIESDGSDLVPGRWGIPEPSGLEAALLDEIDLVFVPGVAFDEEGYRLGFGKGFYDRALSGCQSGYQGIKIGLSYEFQVQERIPRRAGDLHCDYVMTEVRVFSDS